MSDEFNKKSQIGWQIYGAISGFTGSVIMGAISMAMYVKPDASNWWLAGAIMGGMGAVGSIYSFALLLKEDMKQNRDAQNKDKHPPEGPKP